MSHGPGVFGGPTIDVLAVPKSSCPSLRLPSLLLSQLKDVLDVGSTGTMAVTLLPETIYQHNFHRFRG